MLIASLLQPSWHTASASLTVPRSQERTLVLLRSPPFATQICNRRGARPPQGHTCPGGAAVLALLRVCKHQAREAEGISKQPLRCKGSIYLLTEWPSAQHSTPTSGKKTQQNRGREKIWGLPKADPPMRYFLGEPSSPPLSSHPTSANCTSQPLDFKGFK